MTTKHTATLPDGTIAKRTSASRVYPYVIAVAPRSVESMRDDIRASNAQGEERIAYYRSVVEYLAGGGEIVEGAAPYPFDSVRPVHAPGLAYNGHDEARESWRGLGLMGEWSGVTLDDFRAKTITRFTDYADAEERRIAEAVERISTLTVGKWTASAWASRPELAEKTAESVRRLDPRREVRVLVTERN